jgi:hypothetical protein
MCLCRIYIHALNITDTAGITHPVKLIGYGLNDRGIKVRFLAGTRNISLLHKFQTDSEAHPVSYTMGTRPVYTGVNRLGREAHH